MAKSQAANNVTYMQKFQEMITSLYYYMKHSAVRVAKLQEVLDAPLLKIKEKTDLDLAVVNPALEAARSQLDCLLREDGPHLSKFLREAGKSMQQYKGRIPTQKQNTDLAVSKLPLHEELLKHAEVADISQRVNVKFESVLYFVRRFDLVSVDRLDHLENEFVAYQVENIPEDILRSDRADVSWYKIGRIFNPVTSQPKFALLAMVMLTVLIILHSNADTERIFSIVRKVQTEFRPNLSRKTLEAICVQKLKLLSVEKKCYEAVYNKSVLMKCKSATYTKLHM
ncbi:UNVERIFIED_CONTAM: hypothetical protein FKN15_039742 [Acipenser sinensis]